MLDCICLKELEFLCKVGFHKHETLPQKIVVDIKAFVKPMAKANFDDPKFLQFNYFEAYTQLKDFLNNKSYKLIEALAESMCEFLLKNFGLPKVEVTIHKFPEDLPELQKVSYTSLRESL